MTDNRTKLRREDEPVREHDGIAFPGIGSSNPPTGIYAVEKPTRARLAEVQAWLDERPPLPKARVSFATGSRGRK